MGEHFHYHHTGIPIRKKQNYRHTWRGLLLSLGCNRDAPHVGAGRLLRQARVGGLGAARSRLPIGPGTRRSGSESLQSFIEGGGARALRGARAAWLGRGCSVGDLCRAPGLSFLTKVAVVAPRAPRLGLGSGPDSHSSSRGGLDSHPRGLAARPRRVGNVSPRPATGARLSLA